MKIAIVGTRGIPARYGGFETCAEELATGLVKRGHRVLVSCRRYLYEGMPPSYSGVELCYPPSIRGRITDTFSHTFFSVFKALLWAPDAILLFNAANSPLVLLPGLLGKRVVINVDGLEWKRAKWGRAGRVYYRFAEFLSCRAADVIIADARAIGDYYMKRYGRETVYIPYGAHPVERGNPPILRRYGLRDGEYFFMGSRLEPENNHAMAISAFMKTSTPRFLVIAGGTRPGTPYTRMITRTGDSRIRFIGPVYEPGHYEAIGNGACGYIHGNEVGGTNPSLLGAMGRGNCVIAIDVQFNREVLGETGLYFRNVSELKNRIEFLLENPEFAAACGRKAMQRVKNLYRWDSVVEDYEKVLLRLVR